MRVSLALPAYYVQQGLCKGTVSVRLSVCPSTGPQQQTRRFTAAGRAGRRDRSIAAYSALPLFAGWQEGHPACIKLSGVVLAWLERGADLQTAQLMPLPPTVSCFSKIQIGFTFVVPAHWVKR